MSIERTAVEQVLHGYRNENPLASELQIRQQLIEQAHLTDTEAGHVLQLLDRYGPQWHEHLDEDTEPRTYGEPSEDDLAAERARVTPPASHTGPDDPRPADL